MQNPPCGAIGITKSGRRWHCVINRNQSHRRHRSYFGWRWEGRGSVPRAALYSDRDAVIALPKMPKVDVNSPKQQRQRRGFFNLRRLRKQDHA